MNILTVPAAQAVGQPALSLFDYILLLLLLGVAGYALYAAIRLRRECYLFENPMLYPGNCPPEQCADPQGFLEYIVPRVFVFSGLLFLSAGLYLVKAFYLPYRWADYVMLVEPLLIFAWYIVIQRKAAKRFWP